MPEKDRGIGEWALVEPKGRSFAMVSVGVMPEYRNVLTTADDTWAVVSIKGKTFPRYATRMEGSTIVAKDRKFLKIVKKPERRLFYRFLKDLGKINPDLEGEIRDSAEEEEWFTDEKIEDREVSFPVAKAKFYRVEMWSPGAGK